MHFVHYQVYYACSFTYVNGLYSLVQSLLGLMGTAPNNPSSPAIASPPVNTLPTGQAASIIPSNTWQQSHATPPPPPPQQPPRQPYNYYQASPPQQYQSPNRNQQYGNSQAYPDQSYSVSHLIQLTHCIITYP
jgi:hypothetical protein